jgi:hypothetical protein
MRRFVLAVFAVLICASVAAAAETDQAKIARALSAAPEWLRAGATVAEMDAHGKQTVLRPGTNGFTCVPGTPGVIGDDAMCADAQGMMWVNSLMSHAAKPANTEPGVIYMLNGGTVFSDSDPYAMTGTPLTDPPHWMIMWPFDAKTSGLSDHRSAAGTWIMWAGTPYAHLMILQKP